MEIDYTKQIDFTLNFRKSRDNINLVNQYLKKLNTKEPAVEVNNDSIRLLLEVLENQRKMYYHLNELPYENSKLRYKNHLLKVEVKKLRKQIEVLTK